MTVSWPHAQQMFHPTGLKQKAKLKKLLESFALPSGHVDREIAHHSFFDFQHLCSWRRWKPWRDISLYNSVRTRQWKAVDRCALLWIISWNWIWTTLGKPGLKQRACLWQHSTIPVWVCATPCACGDAWLQHQECTFKMFWWCFIASFLQQTKCW